MNVFKPSRFDFLNEQSSSEKKTKNMNSNKEERNNLKEEGNHFKNDYSKKSNDNYNYNNKYENKEKREKREEYEKKKRQNEKDQENMKNLTKDNFPELINEYGKDNQESSQHVEEIKKDQPISYINKVTQVSIKEEKIETVQPGWVEIKLDPKTPRKIIYNYGKNVNGKTDLINKEIETKRKTEYEVLEALVNLHNKRTQEYIDMWGYETWEKLYRYQNYDYDYFDRLDEEYEEYEEYEEQLEEDEIY
jgi:hypothetical protein